MHTTLDRPQTKQWCAKSVTDALAQAFRVLNATTGPVGHKRLKAAMPEYEYSASDIAEQKLMEVEAQRKGETTMRKRLLARIKPNSHEISRSDLILFGKGEHKAWLKLVAAYPDHRRILIAAVKGRARGLSGRKVAERLHMPLTTFQRHRDYAAGQIAAQLNRTGVKPW
ncbi:hypothetical protein [Pelagibacterium lentulum]|uniref:Uncharacterized protein n=1 Tax=Pelagibacterium lentulum TaxID=2029865 RepID=A0A916RS17_9HYPH|nr:hypothetical protein [Pelagibacterium lentulum]GGA64842.1 hypothetical protein GCM10011499_39110 [Pelagibacterium lentulum]